MVPGWLGFGLCEVTALPFGLELGAPEPLAVPEGGEVAGLCAPPLAGAAAPQPALANTLASTTHTTPGRRTENRIPRVITDFRLESIWFEPLPGCGRK